MSIDLFKQDGNEKPRKTVYDVFVGSMWLATLPFSTDKRELETLLSQFNFKKNITLIDLYDDEKFKWDRKTKSLTKTQPKQKRVLLKMVPTVDVDCDLPDWLQALQPAKA
jgi:hypothetical protein